MSPSETSYSTDFQTTLALVYTVFSWTFTAEVEMDVLASSTQVNPIITAER